MPCGAALDDHAVVIVDNDGTGRLASSCPVAADAGMSSGSISP